MFRKKVVLLLFPFEFYAEHWGIDLVIMLEMKNGKIVVMGANYTKYCGQKLDLEWDKQLIICFKADV